MATIPSQPIDRRTVSPITPRRLLVWGLFLVICLSLFAVPAAAATSVGELEILKVLNRLHKILRNIAYLLGPIVMLHGFVMWFLGRKYSTWSRRGFGLAVGGGALFGAALALDIILQLVVWIATNGMVS